MNETYEEDLILEAVEDLLELAWLLKDMDPKGSEAALRAKSILMDSLEGR